MSLPPVIASRRCAHEGCPEIGHFEYSSQRERAESDKWYAKNPYLCVRHTKPAEVLGPDNPERTVTLTANPSVKYPSLTELFWIGENNVAQSGLQCGPGFKAYATDFPPGTKLIITAKVELP